MGKMTGLLNELLGLFSERGAVFFKNGFEILLIFILVYVFLRLLEGTRGAGVLKGLGIFLGILTLVVVLVTHWFPLETVNWVLTSMAPVVLIPMFILFQPEIRRAMIRVGQNPLFEMFFHPHAHFTDALVRASFDMARDKIGGLIAIERQVGLSSYVEAGVRLDSDVSVELIRSIFWPGNPLHDGAVVIRHQRIAAAGCLFPLTDNPHFSSDMGTRHRAGIGVTEESDAVVIIISEQTGQVSLAVKGAIQQGLDEKSLKKALEDIAAETFSEG